MGTFESLTLPMTEGRLKADGVWPSHYANTPSPVTEKYTRKSIGIGKPDGSFNLKRDTTTINTIKTRAMMNIKQNRRKEKMRKLISF